MNLRKRISLAWKTITNKSSNQNVALRNLYTFLGIDPDQEENVLSEATYFACMKVMSESIGKLPLKLLRQNERNGVETMRKHPLYRVLHDRPNPYMTSTTFWSTIEFNRNHYGNAYVWIQGAGEDTKLWILPFESVQVYYDDSKVLSDQQDIYYIYTAGGRQYLFGSEEILHFKTSNTLNGLIGISVQDQLKMTIGGAISSQKMLKKMYGSGFTAKTVLNYTGSLNDANVKELVKMVEAYGKGELSNEGVENTIPIPLGFNLTPLNIKLVDNQFIEVKQYTALQIASAFGIKPYQIGDYTKSSYASAEAQQLSFYVDTLLYPIKQYEEEISYKLLSPEDMDDGVHAKFNVAVVLRADFATQIDTLVKAVAGGIYTPNEARATIDKESKDGGDKLLVNGACIPVELTGLQYTDSTETEGTGEEEGKEE